MSKTQEKIGIITCSNAVNDLDCCAAPCLRDLNSRAGSFKDYSKNLQLAGIISCSGCPTLAYPEKIMRKVKSLIEFDVTAIHFSFCMVALCPFLNKYIEIIGELYPNVKLIKGAHETKLTQEQFCEYVKTAFENDLNMNDIITRRVTEYCNGGD